MTDETKKLFDAPWITDGCEIHDSEGLLISSSDCIADANRLARLPELYDALVESVFKFCESCLVKRGMLDEEHPDYDLIKHGCPNKTGNSRVSSCVAMKWIELLQKVRDGE